MIGTMLGHYRILESVGEGGMGSVYRALDTELEREVAIKVMHPDLFRRPEIVERFRTEAITLARLHHPNIATLFQLSRSDQRVYMVMEFADGETLEDVINRSGAVSYDRALAIGCQVLDALDYAHGNGVVHRDIKPANLVLTSSGVVKVTDFGIARVLGSQRATRDGHIVGTLAYMSPEQVRGQEVDPRSDIYSLGVVLYELVAGHVPFSSQSDFDLMAAQLNQPPAPLETIAPGVPSWAGGLILKALAKAPSDRYGSAREFRDRIEEGMHLDRGVSRVEIHSNASAERRRTSPGHPVESTRPPDNWTPTVVAPAPVAPGSATPRGSLRDALAPLQPPNEPSTRGIGLLGAMGRLGWKLGAAACVAIVLVILSFAVSRWRRSTPTVEQQPVAAPVETAAPPPASAVVAPPAVSPQHATKAPSASIPSPRPNRERRVPSQAANPAQAPPAPAEIDRAPVPQAPPAAAENPPAPVKAAEELPASPPSLPTETFNTVRIAERIGDKTREIDVVLRLTPKDIVVVDKATGRAMKSFPYRSISSVLYSNSRRPPRRSGGSPLGALGALFRGTKHWLTIEAGKDYAVLQLHKDDYRSILPALEKHSGLKIERTNADR